MQRSAGTLLAVAAPRRWMEPWASYMPRRHHRCHRCHRSGVLKSMASMGAEGNVPGTRRTGDTRREIARALKTRATRRVSAAAEPPSRGPRRRGIEGGCPELRRRRRLGVCNCRIQNDADQVIGLGAAASLVRVHERQSSLPHGQAQGRVAVQARPHLLGGQRPSEQERNPALSLELIAELGRERSCIPDRKRMIGGRATADGELTAVGMKGHAGLGPVHRDGEYLLGLADAPELHREIVTGGCKAPAVGGEGHAPDPLGVAGQGDDLLARGQVPELHCLVVAGGGEAPARRGKMPRSRHGPCGRVTCAPPILRPCPRPAPLRRRSRPRATGHRG